mgnify:CR=1 FL=1|tara:strand:+ start:14232 stop:15002 length:771 start_codon:yes stop_codon:yes gene_type:complete
MMDRIYGFPASARHFHLYEHDSDIKRHPAYLSAKQGNDEAAFELVWSLASEFLYSLQGKFSQNIVYVSPFAREASGDNAIPPLLSTACASFIGGQAENDIVQVEKVYHTGADPMERMSLRPSFEGEVLPGQPYVLVDDVTNMGGTLAELANYILINGGTVEGSIVLCNAGRSHDFIPSKKAVQLLNERFGNEIKNIFGISTTALTANEANYLVGFKSADAIRNRLTKAEKETIERLRSKGIYKKDAGKGNDGSSTL